MKTNFEKGNSVAWLLIVAGIVLFSIFSGGDEEIESETYLKGDMSDVDGSPS